MLPALHHNAPAQLHLLCPRPNPAYHASCFSCALPSFMTVFLASLPNPTPPQLATPSPVQRNGKDPLADIIAASAARKRDEQSALADELLKECRINQVGA